MNFHSFESVAGLLPELGMALDPKSLWSLEFSHRSGSAMRMEC
jgi:hypothetical protein